MPFAAWVDRDVVRASGPDTVTFFQGQLSQDVAAMVDGESRWSLLLAPTGKVDAWLRVTRVADDEVILDTDAGWGDAVVARLQRFKLRTKCDLEPVDGWRCRAVRGTTVDDPSARAIVWPGVVGVDLLGPADDVAPPSGIPLRDDAYEELRIESGVPAMGRELTESTIPVEGGQWLIDASVSFTKGCYTGQELVARIDSRGGNAPRPVRGLRLSAPATVPAEVTSTDGKVLGNLTSVYETVALAPLPRSVVPPADVLVDGHPAQVVDLPMQ
jgi:folate-binding protein YgfZ